ncbi:MAG: type II secretion system protein GspG [Bradymonadales bacterium]|nr:type II secretion system protein GspG [Bradymonadales bacterium]
MKPNTQHQTVRQILGLSAKRAAMTLVEIMIVLTIMAGIMAFAAYSVVGYLQNAKIKEAQTEVATIKQMVELYLSTHGSLPDQLSDLEQDQRGMARITERLPDDPWENPYEYDKSSGWSFTVFSLGPDGQSGTDDDIYPEGEGPMR